MNIPPVILLGTLPLDLDKTSGGVESVCVDLLEGLKETHDGPVDWIAFSSEVTGYTVVAWSPTINLHYIPIAFPRSLLLDYFFNRKMLNRIIRSVGDPVIHVQGSAPHLLRLTGFPKKRIVVTQHGIMAAERNLVSGVKNKLKFTFKYLVERYYFPRFRHIIFISDYNRKLFPNKAGAHTRLIRNPVNNLFFQAEGQQPEPMQLLYVGWISQLKNLELLLLSLADLKKEGIVLRLTIAGGYKEAGYCVRIGELVREHALSEQLCFTGPLPRKAIFDELRQAEILVVPSLQENSPVSIAEAMAMGKVVVASDVGAISEMIQDRVSGLLFEKNNRVQLTYLLHDLYSGRINRKQLAANARKKAVSTFLPNVIAQQTLTFYAEMKDHE